jgi:hypothetical protein
MATGQSLLDRMELLNQELQLQPGEADVTRGLLALNVAQDYFESLAAARGKILGGATGTVSTAASTESTAFPSGCLRIDALQMLNSQSRPDYPLKPIRKAGGHANNGTWPWNILMATGSGKPVSYYTNGTSIYWSPLPDSIYTVRWYGAEAATDITASGTFLYKDIVMLPLASFAVRLFKSGLDDSVNDLDSLAQTTFKATLDAMEMFQRDGAAEFQYTQTHTE